MQKDKRQITAQPKINDQQGVVKKQSITLIAEKETSIFSPEVAEYYEKLVPKAADKILTEFLKTSEANRQIRENREQAEIEALRKEQERKEKPFEEIRRKDWMGYSLLLFLLGSSIISGIFELEILSYSSLVLFSGLIIKAFFYKPKK